VIERVVPAVVVVESARLDPPEAVLLLGEAELVGKAVPRRRAEFATARHCARVALGRLGQAPVAILADERRAPRWPAGFVGSLTHCDGYRAAAVARDADVLAVGVDAEPDLRLPDGVDRLVLRDAEREQVARLADRCPGPSWDRVIFSVKESVYKVWSPLTGRWLGFEEAEVWLRPAEGTFEVRVLAPEAGRLARLTGRFVVAEGLIATAVTIEAAAGEAAPGEVAR
jgi:4'-phosphopantetheinyl transferase EntD